MLDKVLTDDATGEIVVKKSRFIAHLQYVETTEQAEDFIKSKKKQYHDARHNCSCYIIGRDGNNAKSSDDGEPSGTAGRPMLEVIEGAGLYNVVAVVTRYFGGVLLGTGGLVRAYQDAVKEALEAAKISTMMTVRQLQVKLDYTNYPKLEKLCKDKNYQMEDVSFLADVTACILTPVDEVEEVTSQIVELTNGKCKCEKLEEKEVPVVS